MRLCFKVQIIIAFFTFTTISAQSNEEIYYRVSGDNLRCLIENFEKYIKLPDDLLVIYLEACPQIIENPLLAATKNENPDIPRTDDRHLDQLIVVKKSELKCIADLNTTLIDSNVYRILPENCVIRPDL